MQLAAERERQMPPGHAGPATERRDAPAEATGGAAVFRQRARRASNPLAVVGLVDAAGEVHPGPAGESVTAETDSPGVRGAH